MKEGMIVWNVTQDVEVPYNPNLDVERNPNLEWREDPKAATKQPVAETTAKKPAAKKKAAPKKPAPVAKKKA